MPRLAVAATRRRGLIVPAAFGLLLFVVGLAGSGASGILPVVLLSIVLPLVVMAHRALGRERRDARPATGMLEKPGELVFAVVVAVAAGGVMTFVASVVLATAAPTLFGDGRLLIRMLLVVFVLGPCVGLGSRCGRWWAFTGASALIPLLGFCVIVAGPRSWGSVGFVFVSVSAAAFALAAGALRHALAPVSFRLYEGFPAAPPRSADRPWPASLTSR